jgi:hypothetical protein
MSAATNYTESLALKYLLTTDAAITRPTTWFVGLFTSSPTEAGTSASPGGTEVSGGGYARRPVTFTVATDGSGTTTAKNSATLTFPSSGGALANWGTITHIAIFDVVSGTGNMIFYGSVTNSKQIDTGDSFQITQDNLSIELQ